MISPIASYYDESLKDNTQFHIRYEIITIFMDRTCCVCFTRTALIYILQPIGIHSYFHNSDSFIYALYFVHGHSRLNIDMRYEGSTQPTLRNVQQHTSGVTTIIFLFSSPSSASQKKDLSLLHIFTLHATLTRKNS